jgi:D-3-phosphoglycerate dehydrogenase / 2-oxoglutarate reductase
MDKILLLMMDGHYKMNILVLSKNFGNNTNFFNKLKKNKHIFFFNDKELTDKILSEIDTLILGTYDIKNLIIKTKSLKRIYRIGKGVDNIPLDQCKRRNIKVTLFTEGLTSSVSEFVIGLALNLVRNITISNNKFKIGYWEKIQGKTISDLSIGIVGFGAIGKDIFTKIKVFKPKKIYIYDLVDSNKYNNYYTDFDNLLENSDLISINIPLNNNTHNLFNSKVFDKMKKKPYIVNTSRGGIINENDLISAIKKNKISGAALDVFEKEPYPKRGDLTKLDNLILTPHIASNTFNFRSSVENAICKQINIDSNE